MLKVEIHINEDGITLIISKKECLKPVTIKSKTTHCFLSTLLILYTLNEYTVAVKQLPFEGGEDRFAWVFMQLKKGRKSTLSKQN